jgi:DNA-3-methyladenine glycosylase
MAGPPGIAYVYLVYGMYDCLNVVSGPVGAPSAVLIRAVEPLAGADAMRAARLVVEARRRRVREDGGLDAARARIAAIPDRRLAAGPGLVGACFGVDPAWTGTDLCDPSARIRLEEDPAWRRDDQRVVAGQRVGVAYAGSWAERPWRFHLAGHPSVSRAR